jgi:hypothetical protein
LTTQEIVEKQYLKGKISRIPTLQQLTKEEREARKRRGRDYAKGKPTSEIIIEDRGPY